MHLFFQEWGIVDDFRKVQPYVVLSENGGSSQHVVPPIPMGRKLCFPCSCFLRRAQTPQLIC